MPFFPWVTPFERQRLAALGVQTIGKMTVSLTVHVDNHLLPVPSMRHKQFIGSSTTWTLKRRHHHCGGGAPLPWHLTTQCVCHGTTRQSVWHFSSAWSPRFDTASWNYCQSVSLTKTALYCSSMVLCLCSPVPSALQLGVLNIVSN